VPAADAEIARARLLPLAPHGFEEVERDSEVELAVYTDARGEAAISGAFEIVTVTRVAAGWEHRWREFHRPVEAGGLWIGPPWEAPSSSLPSVVIDPGRAFGTGAHATTRACLELLARCERGSVLDAGCGSGVLAIAAVKLGFAPVSAMDVDSAAVEATRANAERNGAVVEIVHGDATSDALPPADVLVANIELQAVETLLVRRPARSALVSGYLAHEAPAAPGWTKEERIVLDGWAADRVVRLG
jgi:ribosomal protein L11 methyltransferase